MSVFPALVGGLGVFERIFSRSETAFNSRTCVGYIYTHIRSCGSPEDIYVSGFSGSCLEIPDESGEFVTKIYCHQGWLTELFCEKGSELSPEDGERVMKLESILFFEQNGLLKVTFANGETKREAFVNLFKEVQNEE